MTTKVQTLSGVYAAVVTPLTADLHPDLDAVPALLDHLAQRGCHGALIFGTTGEGPSFSLSERTSVLREAARYRDQTRPDFKLLAGTGRSNLPDTIELTRLAFEAGVNGVVTLPPYYFKNVSAAGLTAYFDAVVRQGMPADGQMYIYHFPQVAGVPVPNETIAALRARYPHQVAGMKDSQDDLPHTLAAVQAFPGFAVFAGSDSILTEALQGGAAGCITALANVTSPLNRAVWEAHQRGESAPAAQAKLNQARQLMKGLNGPAAMKAALTAFFGFKPWPMRPPLEPLSAEQTTTLLRGLEAVLS